MGLPTTVLVTGGAGYIGSHVVAELHRSGRKVVVLDDFSNSSSRAVDALREVTVPGLPVVEGDAADRSLLRSMFSRHGVASVIHLAAFKSVPESAVEPLRYYRNNLDCTMSLAETAVEMGVVRLVFSSSAAVYGAPRAVPVAEDSPLAPISPYAQSKLVSEQILADCAAASRLEVVLLRCFNPVGAHPSGVIGEDPVGEPGNLVPRVMQTMLGRLGPVPVSGGDYDTPDGTAVRDYVHVVDLAEGHLAALDSALPAAAPRSVVYNLGTGVGHTVLDVLATAAAVAGRPVPHEIVGRRPGDMASMWSDCRRARRELRWYARRDLTCMMRDHWHWQRRNPDGYASRGESSTDRGLHS